MSEEIVTVTFDLEACISVLEGMFFELEADDPMIDTMFVLERIARDSGVVMPDVCGKPWSTFRRHRVGLQAAAPVLKQHCQGLGVESPRWEELLMTLSDTLWENEDYESSMSTWMEHWRGMLPKGPFEIDLSHVMLCAVYERTLEALNELGPFEGRRKA
jgi:hypothetical protein